MDETHAEVWNAFLAVRFHDLVDSACVPVNHGPARGIVFTSDFEVFEPMVSRVIYLEIRYHDVVESFFAPSKIEFYIMKKRFLDGRSLG